MSDKTGEPAYSFDACVCGDPECGSLHLVARRTDGSAICELVIAREQLQGLLLMSIESGLLEGEVEMIPRNRIQ
jgi:hypothetical protein